MLFNTNVNKALTFKKNPSAERQRDYTGKVYWLTFFIRLFAPGLYSVLFF